MKMCHHASGIERLCCTLVVWPFSILLPLLSTGKPIGDVTLVILDRARHADTIRECREVGCRIRLISDGDVAAAIEVAKAGTSADMMFGIGGTPEGAPCLSASSAQRRSSICGGRRFHVLMFNVAFRA